MKESVTAAITRIQQDDKTGEDVELEIPYMKAYNVERSDARLPFWRTFVAQIFAHRCKNQRDEARSDTLTYCSTVGAFLLRGEHF